MTEKVLRGAALAAHEAKVDRDAFAASCRRWLNCDSAPYDFAPNGYVRIRRGDYFTIVPAGSVDGREVKDAT
jgi:hypothetical protein